MSEFFRKSLYRPSAPRLLQVKRSQQITPGLLRLTLTGDGLEGFPTYCPAAHVKLFLARDGQTQPVLPRLGPDGPVWPTGVLKPIVRTYSVREFRHAAREIDIEFALHGIEGPATRFARQAKPGAYIGLSYPGGPDPMILPASRYVLAGDMSTVPALASILDHLDADAQGNVFIRTDAATDIRDLTGPAGVKVRWFVGGPTDIDKLVAEFKALPTPSATDFFWIGGEHTLVVTLRRHLVENGVSKDATYALPYWRHRFDEEGYHETRDEVMNGEDK